MIKKPAKSKKPYVSLNLRLPPDLHKRLKESAEGQSPRNSLNREILERLYESFRGEDG